MADVALTPPKGVVVIITKDLKLQQQLKSWLLPLSFEVLLFDHPMDWKNSPERHRKDYVGVWIELKGLIGLPQDIRTWLTSIEDTFPVVKIIAQKEEKDFSANVSGEIIKGRESILKIFSGVAKYFEPRGMRSNHRVQIFHRIRAKQNPTDPGTNCNTFNISDSGAMLTNFGASIPFKKDQLLSIEFMDFPEFGVFQAVVMWTLAWDSAVTKLPGIGVMFQNVPPEKVSPLVHRVQSRA